jgi:hypothetical protein
MDKLITVILAIVVSVAGLLFLSFLLSWPVYMLWNGCFVGAIDGVNEVTWLQAWGLSILFSFLFKPNSTSNTK